MLFRPGPRGRANCSRHQCMRLATDPLTEIVPRIIPEKGSSSDLVKTFRRTGELDKRMDVYIYIYVYEYMFGLKLVCARETGLPLS